MPQPQATREFLLSDLLKSVSRSFYLTLRILPDGVRQPIGLAYLLARTADTLADTPLLPPEQRIGMLLSLREQIAQPGATGHTQATPQQFSDAKDRVLLAHVPQMLALLHAQPAADRLRIQHVVATLTDGMQFDLRYFPNEQSGQVAALQTLAELDHYTYQVAGCVGEFWTEITQAHVRALQHWDLPAMSRRGVSFGKALQMTNVLRDCAADLRIGRCYLPAQQLAALGLQPTDLLQPATAQAAQPVLFDLVRHALLQFGEASAYLSAIPRHCVRLRLACLWPILIGLETLLALVQTPAWLDPAQVIKIKRNDIYRIVVSSVPGIASNSVLKRRIEALIKQISHIIN